MKILLVADFSVVHSRRYAHLIHKAGCNIVLLDVRSKASNFNEPFADQHYLWPRRGGERFTRYLLGSRLAANLSEALIRQQLRLQCAVTRPDIIHVQWVGDRAWSFARAGIAPLVLTAWGSDLNRIAEDPNYDTAARLRIAEAISKTDLLIADSQSIVDIANSLVTHALPSMLLPLGIDTSLFRPGLKAEGFVLRRELGIPDTAHVVLSPRALKENYNHGTILKAFARVVMNGKLNAFLVFKAYDCADSEYVSELSAIATEYSVRDRIRIIDEVAYEQLPIFYAMGDFAINFPKMDGFPVTFLECLACELPILTSRLPAYNNFGMPAYLQFTSAATEEALEHGIADLLPSTHFQRNMARARAYVSANFDESVIAKNLSRAYENVIENRNDKGPIRSISEIAKNETRHSYS